MYLRSSDGRRKMSADLEAFRLAFDAVQVDRDSSLVTRFAGTKN